MAGKRAARWRRSNAHNKEGATSSARDWLEERRARPKLVLSPPGKARWRCRRSLSDKQRLNIARVVCTAKATEITSLGIKEECQSKPKNHNSLGVTVPPVEYFLSFHQFSPTEDAWLCVHKSSLRTSDMKLDCHQRNRKSASGEEKLVHKTPINGNSSSKSSRHAYACFPHQTKPTEATKLTPVLSLVGTNAEEK